MPLNETYKTIRIQLRPNNKQNTQLFRLATAYQYVYNWAVDEETKNLKEYTPYATLSENELSRRFKKYKMEPGNKWLENLQDETIDDAISECANAYESYKNSGNDPEKTPKHKGHIRRPTIHLEPKNVKFTYKKASIPGIGEIRMREWGRAPYEKDDKTIICNVRVYFDKLYWWISYAVKIELPPMAEPADIQHEKEGVGIDVGLRHLFYCSNGSVTDSMTRLDEIKKPENEKRLDKLEELEALEKRLKKKSKRQRPGSKNAKETRKRLLKLRRRIENIREDYRRKELGKIINQKPKFICIETLDTTEMKHRREMNKVSPYAIREWLKWKAANAGILLILVPKKYPSSKICSKCGYINWEFEDEEMYVCPICHNEMDRDYNAALNLRYYGFKAISIIQKRPLNINEFYFWKK